MGLPPVVDCRSRPPTPPAPSPNLYQQINTARRSATRAGIWGGLSIIAGIAFLMQTYDAMQYKEPRHSGAPGGFPALPSIGDVTVGLGFLLVGLLLLFCGTVGGGIAFHCAMRSRQDPLKDSRNTALARIGIIGALFGWISFAVTLYFIYR